MMRDRSIIFSAPMVRALLAGRKTQTRRLLSPGNLRIWTGGLDFGGRYVKPDAAMFAAALNNARDFRAIEDRLAWVTDPASHQVGAVMAQWLGRLTYAPGDRLYVREAWRAWWEYNETSPAKIPSGAAIQYAADDPLSPWDTRPRSPIHMPRWASRLTLIVTDVRVQPLLDISEAGAEAEGFAAGMMDDGFGPRDIGGGYTVESAGTYASASGMFQETWAKLHPDWDGYSSPWVVAISFTVAGGNIDA